MTENEKSIDKKIEELKQQKEELWLEEGKAYRCKECEKIVVNSSFSNSDEKEGLCYDCWSKKVKETKRKELMQTFKHATIVDIEPGSNPYSNINEVETITLKVNEQLYKIKIAGYDEQYIEIEKV